MRTVTIIKRTYSKDQIASSSQYRIYYILCREQTHCNILCERKQQWDPYNAPHQILTMSVELIFATFPTGILQISLCDSSFSHQIMNVCTYSTDNLHAWILLLPLRVFICFWIVLRKKLLKNVAMLYYSNYFPHFVY